MRLDEGLAGLVAEQLRPLIVEDAPAHPRFKYFSEAGEDPYQLVPRRAAHRPRPAAGRAGGADRRAARASIPPMVAAMLTTAGTQLAHDRQPGPHPGAVRRAGARAPAAPGAEPVVELGPGHDQPVPRPRSRPVARARSQSGRAAAAAAGHDASTSAPSSSRCTAASTTPTAGCRNTWRRRDTWGARHAGVLRARPVAYFSAEFGLHESLPIYSGGLGVLAGDHIKSGVRPRHPAGRRRPLLRPGLLPAAPRRRRLAAGGVPRRRRRDCCRSSRRSTRTAGRSPSASRPAPARIAARVWQCTVGRSTLLLLDSDVEGNTPEDRELTARLYGGDDRVRIRQELLLGVGGVRALRRSASRRASLHLNEGHSAFAALELDPRSGWSTRASAFDEALRDVASQIVFTTHTPVPAGHDRFSADLVEEHLGPLRDALGIYARRAAWGWAASIRTTSTRRSA